MHTHVGSYRPASVAMATCQPLLRASTVERMPSPQAVSCVCLVLHSSLNLDDVSLATTLM